MALDPREAGPPGDRVGAKGRTGNVDVTCALGRKHADADDALREVQHALAVFRKAEDVGAFAVA